MTSDLKNLTLVSVVKAVREKKIGPFELTHAVLERTQSMNERLAAFITITADHALSQARMAEKKSTGALRGVPISLKDLFDTKGIVTTAGSKVFEKRVPTEDGTIVKMLNAAGSTMIGKANLHEFAFGVTTINPHFGTAKNPWNTAHMSGGSSGGSGVAIAASLGFGSLGSDTGGSIRIPASLCGVVGLKPTYGRCSLTGIVPLSWSLDHPCPIGQTVEDVALLMNVISGHDPSDPHSQKVEVPSFTAALTGNIRGVRVGIPRSYFFEQIEPEVDGAVRNAIRTLENLGARLVDIDLKTAPLQRGVWSHIACPEAYSYHEKFIEERAEDYGPDIRTRIEVGRLLLSIDYVRAQRARMAMRNEAREVMNSVDVIVTPMTPIVAPRIDQTSVQWSSGTEPVGVALTRFTRHFNLTGAPAISIPCGFSTSGLPIGLQIAGRPFDEATVLRVAHAYEQDAGWFQRRPMDSN